MKLFYSILALLSFTALGLLEVHAQSPTERVIRSVEQAISKGDARNLSNFFPSYIEITVNDNRRTFSRQQAMLVMDDFFRDVGGQQGYCEVLHIGNTSDGSTVYALGEYRTSRVVYEINLFFKSNGRALLINQMRFNRKN